jgi:hypothetical protein
MYATKDDVEVQRWEKKGKELEEAIVRTAIRMTDHRPPQEADHRSLKRLYDAVGAFVSHGHDHPHAGGKAPALKRDPSFAHDPKPNCTKCHGQGRYLASYPTRGGQALMLCECVKE